MSFSIKILQQRKSSLKERTETYTETEKNQKNY